MTKIDKNRSIRLGLTHSKKGIYVDTPDGRYLTDIDNIVNVMYGDGHSIKLNFIDMDCD